MPVNSLHTLKEIEQYHFGKNEAHLVLDTNVLLIFLVGIYDINYLRVCSLTIDGKRIYDEEDFKLVEKIIKIFPNKIVVTPHIISEVNMLSQIKINEPERLRNYFSKLIKQLENYKEDFIPLKILLNSGGIVEFGITDISLIEIARQKKWLILTNDSPFYYQFVDLGFVINLDTIKVNEGLM